MPFELRYHPAVAAEDIPLIPQNLLVRIAGAIESRLTHAPHQYGAPLRKTLRGYWKLRVGDYRVVYKIEVEEVWVLGIKHRKTVYEISYRELVDRVKHPRIRLKIRLQPLFVRPSWVSC